MGRAWRVAAHLVGCALAIASVAARAEEGAAVVLAVDDVLAFPRTAAEAPYARLGVLRELRAESDRYFVNDMRGPLYVVRGDEIAVYLDLARERPRLLTEPGLGSGFSSFDFHPDFAGNGLLYTVHTEAAGESAESTVTHRLPADIPVLHHVVVTEWSAREPTADRFAGTSRELMRIEAPHEFHNVGDIAFDPFAAPGDDGYGLLYIALGDFGLNQIGRADVLAGRRTVYGAVLRVDPLGRGSAGERYAPAVDRPADAPEGLPAEVYAYGFRHPHRLVWSPAEPGTLYVVDIGEATAEEFGRVVPGADHGWPSREGVFDRVGGLDAEVSPVASRSATTVDPLLWYGREQGRAIAGAVMVPGPSAGPLTDALLVGDIVTGRLYQLPLAELDAGRPRGPDDLVPVALLREGQRTDLDGIVMAHMGWLSSRRVDLRLARDRAGTVYLMTRQDGVLRRLVEAGTDVRILDAEPRPPSRRRLALTIVSVVLPLLGIALGAAMLARRRLRTRRGER